MSDTVPSICVVCSPDWLLYSGKTEVSELNGTEKAYLRRAYCASGVRVLDGSRLLRPFSQHTKHKLATAFLDIADEKPQIDDESYEEFRLRCQAMGVPLVVIIFALNVAFQLLLEWWRRRNPASA